MSSFITNAPPQQEGVADQYLSRKEAARYLLETFGSAAAISASTLAKLATLGGGPEFRRFGRRVGYTRQSLDSFVSSRASGSLRNTATPDYRAQEHVSVSSPVPAAMAANAPAPAELG